MWRSRLLCRRSEQRDRELDRVLDLWRDERVRQGRLLRRVHREQHGDVDVSLDLRLLDGRVQQLWLERVRARRVFPPLCGEWHRDVDVHEHLSVASR